MRNKDGKVLFSQVHQLDSDWTTRIQIGHRRFRLLERIIDWFILSFNRPKLTESNLEHYERPKS